MRHATVAASVFLAFSLAMVAGAYAQTKSTNCGHPTPAEAGGGNGGKQPEYAQAGPGNGGATKPAEAGGGNGGKQPEYAQAGLVIAGRLNPPRLAEAMAESNPNTRRPAPAPEAGCTTPAPD